MSPVATIHFAEFAAAEEIVQAALNDEHFITIRALTRLAGDNHCELLAWVVSIVSSAGSESGEGNTLIEATAEALKKCL